MPIKAVDNDRVACTAHLGLRRRHSNRAGAAGSLSVIARAMRLHVTVQSRHADDSMIDGFGSLEAVDAACSAAGLVVQLIDGSDIRGAATVFVKSLGKVSVGDRLCDFRTDDP